MWKPKWQELKSQPRFTGVKNSSSQQALISKPYSAAWPGFRFGGNILGSAQQGVRGRSPPLPQTPENVGELAKNFLRKLKNALFQPFFKKIGIPCANFSRVWTKNTNCAKKQSFLQQFFTFQGETFPMFTPTLAAPYDILFT